MKKKIALLLAAVMVVGSLPMTAFASTTNTVSSIDTVEDGDHISASVFVDEFKGIGSTTEKKQTVKLTLTNAKFDGQPAMTGATDSTADEEEALEDAKEALEDAFKAAYAKALVQSPEWNIVVGGTKTENVVESASDFVKAIDKIVEAGDLAVDTDIRVGIISGDTFTGKATDPAIETEFTDLRAKATAYETAYDALKDAQEAAGELAPGKVKYTKISDTEYMAEFYAKDDTSKVELMIEAEADGSGDATVTLEAVDSVVSSQTLKIANIASGATTTTISGTTAIKENGADIKNVVITETTAGTIEAGKEMRVRLTNGFEFTKVPDKKDIVVFPTGGLTVNTVEYAKDKNQNVDKQELVITFSGVSTTASTISLGNLNVAYDEDDVEVGDECEITISGAGTTKQSVVIGTASDYAVSFTAEDKDLPTFYAGTYSEDTESLVVTIKEGIEDSWITGRTAKIVFPEGVEVVKATVEDDGNTNVTDATNENPGTAMSIDENEVEFKGVEVADKKKAELELKFELSVAPDFTGDIEATLTGSGVGDDQTVTVGTAVAPVTVEADVNELMIDYRNTEASDIVITEADAGVLKKDSVVRLAIDGISFDGDPTVEVESGDLDIKNVKVDGGNIYFTIKTESQKEAGVIRISDVNLYMSRSLPAGEYDLQIIALDDSDDMADVNVYSEDNLGDNAIIRNYNDDDKQGTFDVDKLTAVKGYVTVVTAGRDQDDSTFTTTVTVTIGADKMYAGTKEIALDVPAYIANGYTMLPVRAVTEALSGSAIVRWDDPTDTVTITFGQRVISMTVGSSTMKINGVDVAMQAQCEITGDRAFIPLRDLGYALGLNDSKIKWDDATKTATLN